MSSIDKKKRPLLGNKKITHSLLSEYDIVLEVAPHQHILGGIAWQLFNNALAALNTVELAKKLDVLLKNKQYKKPIYPPTIVSMLRASQFSFEIIEAMKSILPKKHIFCYNKKPLRCDLYQGIALSFRLQNVGNKYKFSQILKCRGVQIDVTQHPFKDYGILLAKHHMYTWKSAEDMEWFIKTLHLHDKLFDKNELEGLYEEYIFPLLRKYTVHVNSFLIAEYIKNQKPMPFLTIRSEGNKVRFELKFLYSNIEVSPPCLDRYYVPTEDYSKFYQIDRNVKEEEYWINEIFPLHSDAQQTDDFKWYIPKKSFTKAWSDSFFDTLQELNVSIKQINQLTEKARAYTPAIKIRLSKSESWFDADIQVKINGKIIPIEYLQNAILSNKDEVYINEDTYLLSKDWLKKYRNIFMWGKIKKGKLRFSNYQDYLFDLLLPSKQLDSISSAPRRKIMKKPELPKSLKKVLRSYQREGFEWMNILQQTGKGGILADDMGLGKTIQTLAQLLKYYETYAKLSALVVCPASIINNWKEEIEKFAPDLKYFIYHSQFRNISAEMIANHQVVITSYNILQRDLKILQNIYFDYVVLDESQFIKNSYNKTSQCAFKLNSKHRLCLSGTPLQNHTFDIYSQVHFLNPGTFGTVENFKNRFAVLIDQHKEKGTENELKKLLTPFILRRTKKQVAKDLPEKSENIVYCNMEEEQREIYEYYRERNRNYLLDKLQKEGLVKSKFHVLQGLTFLRQICNSPSLVKQDIKYDGVPIKLKVLQERLIDKEADNKALIFSQFIGMLSLIKRYLKEEKWNYAYFDGKTSLANRVKEIDRFQTDPLCKLFLISIKAGSVGLNLTAADYVYLIDPWWNPAVEQQAIDRTHRIGQSKNIFAYKFICKNTIEEKIMTLQKRKECLAENLIMMNEQSFVTSLNPDDIEYLFS